MRTAIALIAGTGAAGCGTALPLLTPAHPLAPGRMTLGVGASTSGVVGERAVTASTTVDDQLEAATVEALDREAVAPWIGARMGVGADSDVGLTTSIRTSRVDARHGWAFGNSAISVGAGVSALLPRFGSDAGFDRLHGVGFDVPVLLGMRSEAEILRGWIGARGGYQTVSGPVRLTAPSDTSADVTGAQWSAGGVIGLAAGLRPIWVLVELDVSVVGAHADWTFDDGTRRSTTFGGTAFVPGGAILTKF